MLFFINKLGLLFGLDTFINDLRAS